CLLYKGFYFLMLAGDHGCFDFFNQFFHPIFSLVIFQRRDAEGAELLIKNNSAISASLTIAVSGGGS
ncbi:MAG: hypothetical protein PVG96_05395, partial [Desulfobacterales bacterium]